MLILPKISRIIQTKWKNILSFAIILFLVACGGDPENGGNHCETIQTNTTACPMCSFFKIVIDAATSVSNSAWGRMAPGLANVMLAVGAIYIGWSTLKMVASFGKQTAADYLTSEKTGIFKTMFKITTLYLLLTSQTMQQMVIFPLLSGGLTIGSVLSGASGGSFGGSASNWGGMFNLVFNAVKEFNKSAQFIVGLGEAFCCNATMGFILKWNFLQLIYGIVLYCFGYILLVAISCYLIDTIVRLTFAAVLLAPGIAMAVSSITSGYSKKIWAIFLNVFFSFVILGIVLGITVNLITMSLGSGTSPLTGMPSANIQSMADSNNVQGMFDTLTNFGQLVLAIVCIVVLVNLAEGMGKLADHLSETGGMAGDGSKESATMSPMSAMAASPMKGMANQANKLTSWAVDKSVNTAVKTTKYAGHVAARITRFDKLAKKATSARGYLTGTGKEGYRAFWRK